MSTTNRPASDLQLTAGLRAIARGIHPLEAGVELLITHASWLHRGDFVDAFLHTDASTIDTIKLVSIDWAGAIAALDAGDLPSSSGEQAVLRLAASIADGTPVSLRDTLTGLDYRNTHLMLTAVVHASGQRTPSNP